MFNFFRKNKNGEKFSKFDVDIPESALLSIGDEPSPNIPVPPVKHMGKFLKKEDNIITVGICTEKNAPPPYKKNDVISVSFHGETGDDKKDRVLGFLSKILEIRIAGKNEGFTLGNIANFFTDKFASKLTDEFVDKTEENTKYDIYICRLQAVSKLTDRSLRNFFRLDVSVPICYKPDDSSGVKESDGASDMEKGYIKLVSVDISAGGFKCRSMRYIEPGKVLDCMILIGYEALPVSVKVLETALSDEKNGQSSENKNNIYIVRATFLDMDDAVRDRIAMHVIAYQQRARKFQQKLRKLEESYRLRCK